jgi:hypothetical protein
MTRAAKVNEVIPPRCPSPEEMEEAFERLTAWGPEGERIVDVHREMIALLDEMIEKRRGKRKR